MDFELVVVQHIWRTFKIDVCYLARFEGDSFPFQDEMLKSVMFCSSLNPSQFNKHC